jgi:hypothetical protein
LQMIELYLQLVKPLPSERELDMSPDPCDISSTAENPPKPKTDRSFPSNHSEKK